MATIDTSVILSRAERVVLASRVFGLYMLPLAFASAKIEGELIDIDCAMNNIHVPRQRDQLTEQMKTILLEEEPIPYKEFSSQYTMRGFHILSDVSTDYKPIDAICQFEYKGLMISISTAGRSKGACQNEIQIFDGVHRNIPVKQVYTVEEAIKFIDNMKLI